MSTTKIANNHWIIWGCDGCYLKSYNSIVALIDRNDDIFLHKYVWDISATTLKYLKRFIEIETGEIIVSKKQILDKISSGEYKVVDMLVAE